MQLLDNYANNNNLISKSQYNKYPEFPFKYIIYTDEINPSKI